MTKLKKLGVVIRKEFGNEVGFEPKARVVIKLCCAKFTTKVRVDLKNKLSTVTKM